MQFEILSKYLRTFQQLKEVPRLYYMQTSNLPVYAKAILNRYGLKCLVLTIRRAMRCLSFSERRSSQFSMTWMQVSVLFPASLEQISEIFSQMRNKNKSCNVRLLHEVGTH